MFVLASSPVITLAHKYFRAQMAGKSTLLRMTCAAVIMAQLGCYVPASKARIAPLDAIYSRMGASDFIFQSASTFKVEMDDCNKILTKVRPLSSRARCRRLTFSSAVDTQVSSDPR
jgi:hypothetical protein